jgi:hypothetical protein
MDRFDGEVRAVRAGRMWQAQAALDASFCVALSNEEFHRKGLLMAVLLVSGAGCPTGPTTFPPCAIAREAEFRR